MIRTAPTAVVNEKASQAKNAESSHQGTENLSEQNGGMESALAGFPFVKKGFDLAQIPAKRGLQTGLATQQTAEDTAVNAAVANTSSTTLIVDDTVEDTSEGQLRKREFIQQLRSEISGAIAPVLATAGQTIEGCPYLNYWLDFYEHKTAEEVEATVRRYAPDSARATTASQYISVVTQRALHAAQIWARTGRLSGIPEGVPTTLPVKNVDNPTAIKNDLGRGQPLDSGVRSRMEMAFGMNFSHVRTHIDSNSASLSNRVNARAFTVGEHIAFGSGEYKPGTLVGDALIAHELAHTVQQKGAADTVEKMEPGSNNYNALEHDADNTAAGVVSSLWGDAKSGLKSVGQRVMPQLRSGLRIQGCRDNTPVQQQSPPVSTAAPAVNFAGTACSAFDDTITPNAMMVKTGSTNTFNAQISPATSAANVTFESVNTSTATVSPATAAGSPQVVTVTGVTAGATEVQAKQAGTGTVLKRLAVNVKNNLPKTVALHSITETNVTPHRVPAHAPTAAVAQAYLNDVTWGKQANVTFTATRTDFDVPYDLDSSGRLADPVLGSATLAEMNAISAVAKDNSVNFNVYYVNSMEIPTAFTPVGGNETWVDDTQVSSTENTTAHELGHALGRWTHSTDIHDLMVDGDPGTNPCEIRKTDWDTVNP